MTRATTAAPPAATIASDRAAAAPSEASTRPERPQRPDAQAALEIGGPKGPEPTRYGDWERNGRCSDF